MKILIAKRSFGNFYWDASTPEKKEEAVWHLFLLNVDAGYYQLLFGKEEKRLFELARKGNRQAAFNLLCLRQDCEYEGWEFEDVDDPFHEEVDYKALERKLEKAKYTVEQK